MKIKLRNRKLINTMISTGVVTLFTSATFTLTHIRYGLFEYKDWINTWLLGWIIAFLIMSKMNSRN